MSNYEGISKEDMYLFLGIKDQMLEPDFWDFGSPDSYLEALANHFSGADQTPPPSRGSHGALLISQDEETHSVAPSEQILPRRKQNFSPVSDPDHTYYANADATKINTPDFNKSKPIQGIDMDQQSKKTKKNLVSRMYRERKKQKLAMLQKEVSNWRQLTKMHPAVLRKYVKQFGPLEEYQGKL